MTPQELAQLSQQCQQLYERGQWKEACTLAKQSRDLVRQHLGKNHPYYASSLNNLAALYQSTGRLQEAERIFQELQTIQSQAPKEEEPTDYIIRLNNQAEHCRVKGDYDEAEKLFLQALEVGKKTLGEKHPHYIACQGNLALVYYAKGQYDRAEQNLLEMIACHGQNSTDSAPYLNNLAQVYHSIGNFEKAIEVLQQALKLLREVLEEKDPQIASCINNLANLHQELDRYEEAASFHEQAIAIQQKTLGNHHPDLAISLNNLAHLHHSKSNYVAAEPLYRQAMEINRQVWGENHQSFAVNLNGVATLCWEMGKYEDAEPLYLQSTEILRQLLGQDHPDVATSLNNLASFYKSIGKYDKAKSFYQKTLIIRRQVLKENHPDIADSLNGLGVLYQEINNYEDALKCFLKAAQIYQKALGENYTDFALTLNNVALTCKTLGNFSDAESYYTEALNITRQVLGRNHPNFATILSNLADLYLTMGDYNAAELRLQWALNIRRTAFGNKHSQFAASLHNLAEIYRRQGKYAAAESRYRQGLEIFKQSLGENHPDFAFFLNHLAKLCVATNQQSEALELMQKQVAIDSQLVGQVFSISSERQRLAYISEIQAHVGDFLSLILQYFSNSPKNVVKALELVWQRKGIGAEALVAQRDAVLGRKHQYSALKEKLQQLTTWRLQTAQKMIAGPTENEDLESYQKLLEKWNERKEQLEIELAQQIPEIKLERQLRTVKCYKVALALPKNAVLVEFIRFRIVDFQAISVEGQPEWKVPHYLAFILHFDRPDDVQMIDLGEAEPIDATISRFRELIAGKAEERDLSLDDDENQENSIDSEEFVRDNNEGDSSTLRKLIFDPLLEIIGDRTRLFLAPDGDLNRLPFEVLPLDRDRRLIDKYYISYLATGRDLLRFGAKSKVQSTQPLVFADPNFDLSNEKGTAPIQEQKNSFGRRARDFERGKLHFRRLPGTKVEGERIASLLGVKPILSEKAIKTSLKACKSPCILHLATHGFFLKDQEYDRDRQLFNNVDRLSIHGLENPLLRSGLALAGANTWLKNGSLPPEAEDGILTAEDVTGLDLFNTTLVVLSACDTGLGKIHTGEGVFGLRRAFMLAGVKTLIVSLWKVSDKQTQELMIDFYGRLLNGQPCADAFRQAQLEMKKKYPHPRYWGGFICQGDPNSLISFN
ncbi:MAG: Photosystem I assembly protein Ycf3 [Chroococcidiopsis sp. SAG 2025]|uniref:CHAT domain-containing tetratricopeptide repeat protein n=1 Tax=Chroococcidiopsis sp. SAG 2025 TaxID=171389 RepID=UPI002936D946|nr:tetratricopeptide repeat protein [Chroococcidiopsis sp. SAG 2025]MDV2998264.1 Photosystem I assembly protein Ycf3 [Chroococcidiopsis sp. SAG 2025]